MLKKLFATGLLLSLGIFAGCQNNPPIEPTPPQPTEQTVSIPQDSEDEYESNLQVGLKELDLVE